MFCPRVALLLSIDTNFCGRLKKGEHTRYLGAWLADGIDDKEQIKRLDKVIKEVVHRINITRASYAVCRYVAQAN